MTTVNAYWYREAQGINFGDELLPFTLDAYRCAYRYTGDMRDTNLVGIGSILNLVPNAYRGAVWSSGLMRETERRAFTYAQVYALRGRHTLERVTLPEHTNRSQVALGDGGLLLARALQRTDWAVAAAPARRYALGIFPHYVDRDWVLEQWPRLLARPDVCLLNAREPVRDTIQKMRSCRALVSTSLHGLIAADSLQVPNARLHLPSSERILGAGFKFRDYYSVFGMQQPEVLRADEHSTYEQLLAAAQRDYRRPRLDAIVDDLECALDCALQSLGARATA